MDEELIRFSAIIAEKEGILVVCRVCSSPLKVMRDYIHPLSLVFCEACDIYTVDQRNRDE